MKTIAVLPLLFSFLVSANIVHAQLTTIDFPRYSNKNTEHIEITRIERTDTATILFMEAYHLPNYWVKVVSGTTLQGVNTGKSYKLLSSKNFQLDQEIYMPASGNVSFQLFFEPIDKKEQKINFIEGQAEGDYAIKDIELNEDYKKTPIHCHLTGTVVNRPQSSRLILCTNLADLRTNPWISIPIHNGTFDYTLYTHTEEKNYLIFWDDYSNGMMVPVPFFTENGNLQFTLSPYIEGASSSSIYEIKTTAPLTSEMLAQKELQSNLFQFDDLRAAEEKLEKAGGYYTEAYHSFWKKFDETKLPEERDKLYKERDKLEKSGAFYTDAAKALRHKYELRSDSMAVWNLQYIAEHPTLPSLYLLHESAAFTKQIKKDLTPYIDTYHKVFETKFANHPANQQIKEFFTSLNVKVGGQYVDFTAPDLEGNNIRLSDVIKDKVALIDLWASWCGPCRRHSISMIPIYKRYKEKGFTIVGIAREKNNTNDMKAAIEKDGYPWLNLVELNDNTQIWTKYGIPNAAGGTYLVDKTGRILAVDPSAEEVETILEKIL